MEGQWAHNATTLMCATITGRGEECHYHWKRRRTETKTVAFCSNIVSLEEGLTKKSHLETPANGQAVIFLTGLLEVFISEISFWQQYQTTLSIIKSSITKKSPSFVPKLVVWGSSRIQTCKVGNFNFSGKWKAMPIPCFSVIPEAPLTQPEFFNCSRCGI